VDTFYVGNLKGVGRIYQQTFTPNRTNKKPQYRRPDIDLRSASAFHI
jgi:hypothetical protein